ncbi:hypothetical protein IGI04_034227 [Brassica rapa subsp. trilocularis]|uniref:Uncharacterized protein n=1 Tax=Brassica rapa subsp. trilocularis TaxID=1813537 RepID=A0ABQ7L839_BRACM|nr:hypothetical protein IGI04_034227 [Brassica rapa subsp. trilocularis]
MAATKMFLIKWYSSSTNLKVFHIWKTSGTTYLLVVWKSSGLLGSLLTKSSGLHGSLLTKFPFHNRSEHFGFSDLEDFWDDLPVSRLEVVWTSWKSSDKVSSGLPVKSSGSRLNFLKSSNKVSSGLPGSLLAKFSSISSGIQACLCREMIYNSFTTYNSVVHETTEIRLKCKSSGEVKLLKLSIDDLTFSRLRLQISKSIAKITSALTRRLPAKWSTARRLPGKSSTARQLPNSLAYIRLLQAHRITNESHPPRINQNLGFFSSLWRESERYVVFSSQEWKKKKGKSILGALRASNWLFMVVVVLMTMAIL